MNERKTMTTSGGAPVGGNQNSLTVGPRGPVLMQDLLLIEKMAHFNRERIPERVVHAKGSGAHGVFEVTRDITKWTKAKLFESVGKKTEVFVRFSTVGGEKGSGDTERDPRGFAVNRMPDNYFAEVEQAAFAPANIVPGMGYSSDKMLQARILSYPDAHRHRIGVNYDFLPINKAKCPVHTYHRDGHMRFDDNGGREPNYEPNSFGGPEEDPHFRDSSWALETSLVDHYDHRHGNDDFSQAGDLFLLLAPDAQQRLIHNIIMNMKNVPREIQARQMRHFLTADVRYGRGVMDGLCCDPQTIEQLEEPEGVLK